ncbi:Hsp20/alpha crystallin family protein [Zhaonella formicivorans]|uniref:Hsp20/alpha crystallin family protein n=1 Tax=Zhaonella formicivorans TaxID=2528593 RepID=UPI0010E44838|nr:Hsp20/alpha crystallin family protein [Zhaonella formicivorans]
MALIPYEPFRYLENWKREMDRLFNEWPSAVQNMLGPRVDVHETENEVIASFEIPGLEKKDDIHIEVRDDLLSVSGQINRSGEVKEEQMYRKERFIGRFQRSVALPSRVLAEGTKASYRNGILEVRMPKAQADQRKRIDIDFH